MTTVLAAAAVTWVVLYAIKHAGHPWDDGRFHE